MQARSLWIGSIWLWIACSCAGAGRSTTPGATDSLAIVARPGDIAFTNVSVVPMSSDAVLAHHTVVVHGDRIVAVAPSAAVTVPDGVRVIDGTGKWLMPGLADMHVHTWRDEDLTMFVAAGVTTIRNMWGIPQHVSWRSEIARGERLGPTIVTAGDLIDGEPPDWPGSIALTDPDAADELVAAQKAAGYDFLKPVSRLSPEAYAALAAAGKRHGMPMSGHVGYTVGLERTLAARQRSIEHLDGYLTGMVPASVTLPPIDDGVMAWLRAILAGLDPARLPGLIEQTLAAGTWICPTLLVNDRTPELHDAAALQQQVKWLGLIPPAVRARWVRDFETRSFTAEDTALLRATNAQIDKIVAALAAANVPLLVGTDAGGGFMIPGESLHDEIEMMVAAGVPRPRVLRAATADAWRYLGSPREAGVVEAGARADLLLVASDPLTAPLPLVPDGVMLRGRWLPRADLEAQLAEVARHGAPPQDPWREASPLPVMAAKEVHEAHYDIALADTPVGQERIAVGRLGGEQTTLGQIADFATGLDTSYRVGASGVWVAATYHTMKLEIAGKITGQQLVVGGSDLAGKAVSLQVPVPAGAFLSGPGIGGSTQLIARLGALRPGRKRTLTSLSLGYFPAIGVVTTSHVVERKPDAGNHRVFTVASTQHGTTVTEDLIVDRAGLIVKRTIGRPDSTVITRRP